MTQLSPEQWRILDYLYQHKLHTVRPKMTHVRASQKVTDNDLLDLIARDLIGAVLVDDDNPISNVPRPLLKYVRLKLTAVGLRTVLDNPGNQIRYTLGQHTGPITFVKLVDLNPEVGYDDVAEQMHHGLITASYEDLDEFAVIWLVLARSAIASKFLITLTAKGREYLPN
ncbi:hypothetical protein Asp14428_45440 [Actinoplanes sp. NBRC 14428]|nr:hypothetical protein Asp14428_45440 [Actinoplanes sp. NBRC 14428]